MLPHLISDRVKELRAEIASIHHANLLYRKGDNAYTQESGRATAGLNDCVTLWTS